METTPTRIFPVRPMAALNTDAKVEAAREGATAKSATYRAVTADPFAVIASGRREVEIPF